MPAITIKDYTWRQTKESLILSVPFSGTPKKFNLFAIDNYVKASFPPFILELFLWGNIAEDKSTCTLADKELVLSLHKQETGVDWPSLVLDGIDKEMKKEYRNRAMERAQLAAKERASAKAEKCQLLQKAAVTAQINIDTTVLNKIDMMRDSHRKEAMEELEDWKKSAELPFLSHIESEMQENRKAYRPPLKWFKDEQGVVHSRPLTKKEVFNDTLTLTEVDDSTCENNSVSSTVCPPETSVEEKNSSDINQSSSSEDSETDDEITPNIKNTVELSSKKRHSRPGKELIKKLLKERPLRRNPIFDDPSKSVPLPRKSGTISIQFSERAFPTPARESAQVQEQEWLQKQAEARRKVGFAAEDLRPEERDPQWLKNKGDEFFKVGNHLAAISAYTLGIKISSNLASLYVNRSAAHYAVENYYRCMEDCTKALELMEPKCESNRESRARCHARRGAALCKLSAPQHGIPELEAALELTPDNESIKHDLYAAKHYFDVKD